MSICLLATESRTLSKLGLTTSRLAEDSGAGSASNNGLSVGEDSGHLKAAGATNVHEVTAGRRDKLLQFVLLRFSVSGGVEDIDS